MTPKSNVESMTIVIDGGPVFFEADAEVAGGKAADREVTVADEDVGAATDTTGHDR